MEVKVIEAPQVRDECNASVLEFEANLITHRVKTHLIDLFDICFYLPPSSMFLGGV